MLTLVIPSDQTVRKAYEDYDVGTGSWKDCSATSDFVLIIPRTCRVVLIRVVGRVVSDA